jgi:CubicO group peptidase (beta-lactamase class C family)
MKGAKRSKRGAAGGGLSRRALMGAAGLALSSSEALADENYAADAAALSRQVEKAPENFDFQINGPAERVGMSTERLKRIHAYLQSKIDDGIITGAVTAVARRNELIHHEVHGYADALIRKPLALNAIYRMASSTKPVTAVALLMMLEEGKIRLQDPVSRYIPEFREMQVAVLKPRQPKTRMPSAPLRQIDLVPANRQITILDLCTHTSGLMSGGPGTENANIQRTPSDTLATYVPRVASTPLDFQPGTKWQYSGMAGPDVLGRIIEIVSGQDIDNFFHQRILGPLGMTDTYFNVPPEKAARVLPAQRRVNGQWEVTPVPATIPSTPYFATSGGLWSTCRDYMMFEQMLLNRGIFKGQRLLGSRTVELMGTNQIGDLYQGPRGEQPGHGFGTLVRIVLDSSKSDTGRSNGGFGWDGAFGTMSWNDRAEEMTACIMLQQRIQDTMWGFERVTRQAIID